MVYGKGKVFDSKNPSESSLDRGGFVGVDPVYQNYANDTDKPLEAQEEEAPKTSSKKPSTSKSGGKSQSKATQKI